MAKQSAGILAFRRSDAIQLSEPATRQPSPITQLEVFLVHPGGPIWAAKDEGAWSIPKGEFTDEDPLAAANREFLEETGFVLDGEVFPLQPCTLKSGKVVYAWATEADFDAAMLKSNSFEMEWPPRSGKVQQFPEVDRGAWFTIPEALKKINPRQAAFFHDLVAQLEKS